MRAKHMSVYFKYKLRPVDDENKDKVEEGKATVTADDERTYREVT